MPTYSNHNFPVVRPFALRAGDRVGIAAPASPFDRDRFFRGVAILEKMGYSVVYSESIFHADGYLAGSDSHRTETLHQLFSDTTIRAIWCARGGYGSMRLLQGINFELIQRNPKLFIGCSDISALLNAISSRSGLITFHGPMMATFDQASESTLNAVAHALTDPHPLTITAGRLDVITPGNARGPVLGGNLATLCHLLGTAYMPDFSGALVFLEDTGEKPYRIDRMLTQMRLAGCFDRIAGVLLGTFDNCGDSDQVRQILAAAFADRGIPVLYGFDVGHGSPNLTIPVGPEALLDSESGSLSYMLPVVA